MKIAKKRTINLMMSVVFTFVMLFGQIVSASTIVPGSFTATLLPGETVEDIVTVSIPSLPPKVDILFCFDLTGSMGGILDTSKAQSTAIMSNLDTLGVDINYAVSSHMDYTQYYDSYGYAATYGDPEQDYPYQLNQAMTGDGSAVSSAINSLVLGYGYDGPENYSRALYETYADSNLGWRDGAKRLVIQYSDAIPHDNNIYEEITDYSYSTGGDPGRDEIMFTEDDLDFQTVIKDMKNNNIILIACRTYGYGDEIWDYWAAYTGGSTYDTDSSDLVDQIKGYVSTAITTDHVNNLHLVASTGYESWIQNSTPSQYTGPTGVDVDFSLQLKVPDGTAPGTYNFTVSALDENNVSFGEQAITINVPSTEKVISFKYFNTSASLNTPTDTAFDSNGNLYITDFYNNCIVVLDSAGNTLATLGTKGTGVGQFFKPSGISIDSTDHIYVADTYNNRIVCFKDNDTDWVIEPDEWTVYGGVSGNGSFQFNKPMGVTAYVYGEEIYVADTYNHRIAIFDNAGAWTTFGTKGSSTSQFNCPYDVAADSSGNIWVSDTFNNRVLAFDSNKLNIGSYATPFPYGIAIDRDDNVYVAERQSGFIKCITTPASYAGKGTIEGLFSSPVGLNIDSSGRLWVADVTAKKIQFSNSLYD